MHSAYRQRRFKRTTDSGHLRPITANQVDQDFAAARSNKKRRADILRVCTREGWLNLAMVIDPFAPYVAGLESQERVNFGLSQGSARQLRAVEQSSFAERFAAAGPACPTLAPERCHNQVHFDSRPRATCPQLWQVAGR